ncbi:hypothetical protein [Yinghuangia soli]|uniref:Uncharacterized protein n=1 Tax=Yinghuangia soli TaxID=2908204 RepID=A0AA41PZL1_9ACTN|nr:hypothetical protein [Yinghuangia soli]MCF2527352.1 hypothetical protein [Yinghuangia soli]
MYVVRTAEDSCLVYIGKAGPRQGKGIRGRLSVYATGKGAVSGLGEAAFNRALADADWVRGRLAALEAAGPSGAQQWARAAIDRAGLELCWATATDDAAARMLEKQCLVSLTGCGLWNVG